jgi:NDP-sugar pyrophosphorylase family protein
MTETDGGLRPQLRSARRSEGTKVVVLAGGRGTRLAPYTSVLPKPLMPIGEQAILEIVVRKVADHGLTDVVFSVGYLAHLIEAVFGDGSSRGVRIEYVYESRPLGTAGPLRNVPGLEATFLAMNGDVLTDLDYLDFLSRHRSSGAAMTIATHQRIAKIDYGVLHLDGGQEVRRVQAYEEKPEVPAVVSMGVYALEPRVLDLIPPGRAFDIPDLVQALLEAGEYVGAYLFDGFWLDIGRHEDYELALDLFGPPGQREDGRGGAHPPSLRLAG